MKGAALDEKEWFSLHSTIFHMFLKCDIKSFFFNLSLLSYYHILTGDIYVNNLFSDEYSKHIQNTKTIDVINYLNYHIYKCLKSFINIFRVENL